MRKSILIILLLTVSLCATAPILPFANAAPSKWEYYIVNDDGVGTTYGSYIDAQTFTVGATRHTITSVKLLIYRVGSPGNVVFDIRTTDGAGKPTAVVLTTVTINGNSLPTSATWTEITFATAYTLEAGIKYAIVPTAAGGSASNYLAWRRDASAPAYSGGSLAYSNNGGSTWTLYTDYDYMFEVWGNTAGPEVNITPFATDDAGFLFHTWYVEATGRYWIFYSTGVKPVFRSSLDGITFSASTDLWADNNPTTYTQRMDTWFDGTYFHVVVCYAATGYKDYYRRGLPNADGTITWSAGWQLVEEFALEETTTSSAVAVDTNGYPWVTARGGTGDSYLNVASGGNDGTFPYPTNNQIELEHSYALGRPVPLLAGQVYMIWNPVAASAEKLHGRLWNGATYGAEEEDITTTTVHASSFWSAISLNGVIYLVYTDATTHQACMQIRSAAGVWGTAVYVSAGAIVGAPQVTYDVALGNIWVVWGDSSFDIWGRNYRITSATWGASKVYEGALTGFTYARLIPALLNVTYPADNTGLLFYNGAGAYYIVFDMYETYVTADTFTFSTVEANAECTFAAIARSGGTYLLHGILSTKFGDAAWVNSTQIDIDGPVHTLSTVKTLPEGGTKVWMRWYVEGVDGTWANVTATNYFMTIDMTSGNWFIDNVWSKFGLTSGPLYDMLAALSVFFVTSVANIISITQAALLFLGAVGGSIVFWIVKMSQFFVALIGIVGGIINGTGDVTTGLGNLWTTFGGSALTDFLPIVIFIVWLESIDMRVKRTGVGWITTTIGDVQLASYMVSTAFDWFLFIFEKVFAIITWIGSVIVSLLPW